MRRYVSTVRKKEIEADRPLFLLSAIICFQGFFEDEECSLEVFFAKHVGDADFVASLAWGGVETAGRSHHDGFTLIFEVGQAPCAEVVGVFNGEACYGVECAHRDR